MNVFLSSRLRVLQNNYCFHHVNVNKNRFSSVSLVRLFIIIIITPSFVYCFQMPAKTTCWFSSWSSGSKISSLWTIICSSGLTAGWRGAVCPANSKTNECQSVFQTSKWTKVSPPYVPYFSWILRCRFSANRSAKAAVQISHLKGFSPNSCIGKSRVN